MENLQDLFDRLGATVAAYRHVEFYRLLAPDMSGATWGCRVVCNLTHAGPRAGSHIYKAIGVGEAGALAKVLAQITADLADIPEKGDTT